MPVQLACARFPSMILFLSLLGAVLVAAAIYTFWKARAISSRYPAGGTFQTVDGVELHYYRFESAAEEAQLPTLVFLHGASGNALDQVLAFRKRFDSRFDLLFVDRPGHGHSSRVNSDHDSPAGQAQSLSQLLDVLGVGRCVVVGHSLGAAVAGALALEAPGKVAGVVFIAPATHPWPGGVTWYYSVAALPLIGPLFCRTLVLPIAERLAGASVRGVFHPEKAPDGYGQAIHLPLLFRPGSFGSNARDVAYLKRHLKVQAEKYPTISQPALVITGDQDNVVWPSIHSEGLVRDLPEARLITLAGAGHMPHHTHGERVVSEIMQFAEGLRSDRMSGDGQDPRAARMP